MKGAVPKHFALSLKGATHDDVLGILPTTGVVKKIPARLSPGAKATLVYHLIAAYARSAEDASNLFVPLPDGVEFLKCQSHIQLATGSNRSAKTTHAIFKIAEILRGKGEKYGFPAKNGKILALGKDWPHVGDPMWKKLVWPGQFPIMEDEETGLWRSVRMDPTNPGLLHPDDEARKRFWKPGPPFVPLDELKVAWLSKKLDQPKRIVHRKSGWEILFFSAEGRIRQGIDINIAYVDEEVPRDTWIPELLMRLVDRDGKLIWSFTPEIQTPAAYEFHKKAEAGSQDVKEFQFRIWNNPFLPAEGKRKVYESLTPEERRVKWYGEYAITTRRVYPHFFPYGEHGCEAFEIQPDWMRIFSVDPGFQVCAVLFAAVPPPPVKGVLAPHTTRWPELHFYKEAYIQGADTAKYGSAVKDATLGSLWEAAIIDFSYAKQSSMTSGRPLGEHMESEHRARDIYTRLTGNGFFHGSDDIEGRTDSTKHLLNQPGTIRIHQGACANLCREMDGEYYKKDSPDSRDMRHYGHLVWTAETICDYFVTRGGVYYYRPDLIVPKLDSSPAYRSFQKKLRRVRRADRQRVA